MEITTKQIYECYYGISEHDKNRGKVYVLDSYKRFLNTSKGYELSGIRHICPEHGFQFNTIIKIAAYDVFGGAMNFTHQCMICNKYCTIEKSKDYEIREYIDFVWKSEAEKKGLKIIPFEQVKTISIQEG
jgi:hypothetical protein